MLSITTLKKLLDEKNYQEFQNVIDQHFSSEDKMDVDSSQKVTNVVGFIVSNETNFDKEIFSMLTECFRIALDCLIQNNMIAEIILFIRCQVKMLVHKL